VLVDRADDAEAIDDLVGHEGGVRVAGLPVFVVVVALATLDVVGERLRYGRVLAVPADDVRDVIADHAAEPAALLAGVHEVSIAPVGDVRGRSHADVDAGGIAPCRARGLAHGAYGPLGDRWIGELEDEAVTDLARQRERLRSICRDPDLT